MSSSALNALSRASSSYLRSAMHQPIQWHEWGGEAFATAQRENKPILLDIGAVWCHWCHVMDRESYESPEIAQIVNERFIAVKVDRDERPDIDIRYQAAVQAVSGQGGWPLTAFLTPDGNPFYGGTYFPPSDGYGRPSFKRVLLAISDAYREKNGDVMEQAKMLHNAVAQAESFAGRSGEFSPAIVDAIVQSILKTFDPANGGFGSAPKFPHPAALDLLIDRYVRTGDDHLRNVFVTTLDKMARGGMYDQLAGGFHRYSVDERWVVPHFEKMAYDNSELLKNYVHAYQSTGSEFFAQVAKDIIRWMDEWLTDREKGGFYASQDADYSMDDDGDYFTWTLDEVKAALSEEEARVASLYYDVNEVGEMHHNSAKNVLFVRATVEEISKRLNLSPERVGEILQSAKHKMYAARRNRPTPYVDKTMYTSWNALCVSAYLEAARVLDLHSARHSAVRALDRILAEAWHDRLGLLHVITYSDSGSARREVPGLLDDYAFTILACLDAYETTADLSYFHFARRIADQMMDRFFDPQEGGFFDSPKLKDGEDKVLGVLGARRKPFQDSPTPAGNSMAAIALLRLFDYTDQADYRERAQKTLGLLSQSAGQYGLFAATYGIAAVYFSQPHTQVVVLGTGESARRLYASAVQTFQFGKAVISLTADKAVPQNLPPTLAETVPKLAGAHNEKAEALICSGYTCKGPISEPEELLRWLQVTK
jgi:uncharacterized protein YyaL (SSP411 family)